MSSPCSQDRTFRCFHVHYSEVTKPPCGPPGISFKDGDEENDMGGLWQTYNSEALGSLREIPHQRGSHVLGHVLGSNWSLRTFLNIMLLRFSVQVAGEGLRPQLGLVFMNILHC